MRFVVALTWLCCACGATCPKGQPLIAIDGGVRSCIQATDCPRSSNTLVCGSADDRLRDCVACEAFSCVRFQPAACAQ